MKSFSISPLARFNGSSASIRRPKVTFESGHDKSGLSNMLQEIAFFSYDEKHDFYPDERSLRYYHPPSLGADLSKGFKTFEELDDTKDEHLDGLLRTIVNLERSTGKKCEADIMTWRGMMTKVNSLAFLRESDLILRDHDHPI